MSRRAKGFLTGAVLAGSLVSGSGLVAEEPHAQAPPQAVTRVDAPAPTREYQPISPGPGVGHPAIPRDSSTDDRSIRRVSLTPGAPPTPVQRHIEKPPPTERCTEPPNARRWEHRTRDMMVWIKRMARRMGLVMALRVPDELTIVKGVSERPAGWSAYAFAVPAKGILRVTLNHPNEGWFRLLMMDKSGKVEKGMLQNLVKTGRVEVSFKNPLDEVRAVYVLVDDPGWMSTEQSPFVLTIERDWEPGKVGPKALESARGIWAIVEPTIKMEDAVPSEASDLPHG